MAKGFITLSDGRGFSPRWRGYDLLLGLIIDELGVSPDEQAFKQFLQGLVPTPDLPDENEMGWGFVSTLYPKLTVFRSLDLRGLTPHFHQLFWDTLQRAYQRIMLGAPPTGSAVFVAGVRQLLRMRRMAARRASPFIDNDWGDGFLEPFDGDKIGPGWLNEG